MAKAPMFRADLRLAVCELWSYWCWQKFCLRRKCHVILDPLVSSIHPSIHPSIKLLTWRLVLSTQYLSNQLSTLHVLCSIVDRYMKKKRLYNPCKAYTLSLIPVAYFSWVTKMDRPQATKHDMNGNFSKVHVAEKKKKKTSTKHFNQGAGIRKLRANWIQINTTSVPQDLKHLLMLPKKLIKAVASSELLVEEPGSIVTQLAAFLSVCGCVTGSDQETH